MKSAEKELLSALSDVFVVKRTSIMKEDADVRHISFFGSAEGLPLVELQVKMDKVTQCVRAATWGVKLLIGTESGERKKVYELLNRFNASSRGVKAYILSESEIEDIRGKGVEAVFRVDMGHDVDCVDAEQMIRAVGQLRNTINKVLGNPSRELRKLGKLLEAASGGGRHPKLPLQ